VAYAETFPHLHVLGLDVLDRALKLAQQTIAASDAAGRVHVRRQDVAEFTDDDGFDLAWFPAPFIPDPAWRTGLPKVAGALRPGGWLIVGHGKFSGGPLDDAIDRFKTVAFGGTPLNDAEAQQALAGQGLSDVRTLPTPPGAPALTVGRR
jgi:SAM-dependent methyltransferase